LFEIAGVFASYKVSSRSTDTYLYLLFTYKAMRINYTVLFCCLMLCAFIIADQSGIKKNWTLNQFIDNKTRTILYKNNTQQLNIVFKEDGSVSGNLTVNRFSGVYRITSDSIIKIETGGHTKMCCDDAWGERFYDDLGKTNKFRIRHDTLLLFGINDELVLTRDKE